MQLLLEKLALAASLTQMPLFDFERSVKRQYLVTVLIENKFNQCRAAKVLGVHRNTVCRLLHELDIDLRVLIVEHAKKPAASEKPSAVAAQVG